jgi:hypothetical protein
MIEFEVYIDEIFAFSAFRRADYLHADRLHRLLAFAGGPI